MEEGKVCSPNSAGGKCGCWSAQKTCSNNFGNCTVDEHKAAAAAAALFCGESGNFQSDALSR